MTDVDIAGLFNATFASTHATVLVGGAAEPAYHPPDASRIDVARGVPATPGYGRGVIRYREDFAASALHEIAHWCIAGPARRALPDYGYWYVAPPRSRAEREAFYRVEARVQALERILARICGCRFRVSADDLSVDSVADFERAIDAAATDLEQCLPPRAERFINAALHRKRAA